ncbi:MAG: hypothetical protein ACI8ZB_003349 [Desulforhopalus sp.]|jgi:hypothetical protein
MIKKFATIIVTGLFLIGMGGVAQALLIHDGTGYVDVGGYDSFVAQATRSELGTGNGEATELAWINMALGLTNTDVYDSDDYFKIVKEDTAAWSAWEQVYSAEGTLADPVGWAYKLTDQPDYFFVKTGNNQTTTDYRYFLFKNDNLSYDWGAFQLTLDPGYSISEFGKLSHFAQIGGDSAPVPEPATMLLFGTGLAGLAGLRLRKKK